jgi:hypothetical protein
MRNDNSPSGTWRGVQRNGRKQVFHEPFQLLRLRWIERAGYGSPSDMLDKLSHLDAIRLDFQTGSSI